MARFDLDSYIDVQSRINRFWTEHPDGSIVTKLMSPPDDFTQCRYEAAAYKHKDDQRPSAVGYAFELAGGVGPNATSHEENCETSAIGRALANMGYATTREDRPSKQEMQKVKRSHSIDVAPGATKPHIARNDAPREQNAPQRPTSPSSGGTAGEIVDWTAFWKAVKPLGFSKPAELEAQLGFSIKAMTPQQALDAVDAVINPEIPAPS